MCAGVGGVQGVGVGVQSAVTSAMAVRVEDSATMALLALTISREGYDEIVAYIQSEVDAGRVVYVHKTRKIPVEGRRQP
jgi:hypothetical protein